MLKRIILFGMFFVIINASCTSTTNIPTPFVNSIWSPPPRVNERASWSPDGSEIAFVNFESTMPITETLASNGYWQVYVMDAIGTNVRQLTTDPTHKSDLAWSPDGRKIAFVSYTPEQTDIYAMEIDGSHLVRLTQCADEGATCDSPTWSPDGRQIAFFYHRHDYTGPNDKMSGIYLMAADGTSPILLITNSGDGLDWSPTGKELAFHNGGILVSQVDGSRIVRVISDEKDKPGSHYPSWSPDGERIAFERDYEIYIINADGTASTRLAQALVPGQFPSWSPDGRKISFVADIEDCSGIATINVDGTNITCLFRR